MTDMPQTGDKAPDFTLPAAPGETVSLSSLRGRPVVLAFYPADFSPVCSDQMALYEAVKPEFDRYDTQLFGLSVDGVWCHRAFADSRNLRFPLLSDFEPKGEVSRAYGSYDAARGESRRNLFVIDPFGTVFWSFASPNGVNPGADGILAALEAMSAGVIDGGAL
ncbi:redoxin domain-containing protein [Hamadaea sp. NPDC051192]|uniref:redoxin domain-containing protein n=1 Tax=Hamadaea sp. NPDC051192 TaxID=3154940 RepID=UPI00342625C0